MVVESASALLHSLTLSEQELEENQEVHKEVVLVPPSPFALALDLSQAVKEAIRQEENLAAKHVWLVRCSAIVLWCLWSLVDVRCC